MKRFLAIMLSLIMTACFAGCNKAINNQFPNDLVVSTETEHPMITQSPEWSVYNTAAEIVTASTNIYTGKVKSISFEIVNMKTGTADSSAASGKTDCMLYTVYTVDVLKSYKGDNSGEIKICVIGGIAGYRENEQYDALQAAGLYEQYNGIPVVDGRCSLAIDGEYLFCTSRTAGGYDFVINKTQFAHAVNSQNYTAITSAIS